MDNQSDAHSYEYFTHNRPSQYYGELHWARAWPVLVERVGTNADGLYSFPPVAGARTNVSGAVTGP